MSVSLPSNTTQPATHVWLIGNPVGGGGKTPSLVIPLLKLLAKRFADFTLAYGKDGEPLLVDTYTGAQGESRRETCRVRFTAGVEEGIKLANQAAREIAQLPSDEISRCFVIPVGGDGTLSEVVHGLSTTILRELGLTSASLPNIVYLAAGTGADFARLGLCCKTPKEVMQVINASAFVDPSREKGEAANEQDEAICGVRRVDVGSVTSITTGTVRYFTNEASVGLSNAVVVSVIDFKKKKWISCFGGTAVFFAASAYELFRMAPHRFRMRKLPALSANTSVGEEVLQSQSSPRPEGASLTAIPINEPDNEGTHAMAPAPAEVQKKHWEQGDWVYLDSTALVFGNGQFFGGGMKICPHGDPCDQTLSIASWGETIFGYATGVPGIYNGNATTKWKTSRMFTGSRVLVELAPNDCSAADEASKKRNSSAPASPSSAVSTVSGEAPPHAFMETDGEPTGPLPAIIEVAHQINFLMPLPRTDPKKARKQN